MLILHFVLYQNTLPAGSTVVPIIGLSDQTQLTNLSGDKKAWPVYLTIGNILSRTRNSPAKMAILLLALLPVSPKVTGESAPRTKPRGRPTPMLYGLSSILSLHHYRRLSKKAQ